MKLLVFAGSTRQKSFNRQLARATAAMAAASGAEVTHIELADFDIPMYNADLEARGTPDDVIRLKQLMYDHPAWIICTPEYNASYPALVKNTLDWVSSPVKGNTAWTDGFKSTRGKVVGMLSASPRRAGRPALAKPPGAAAAEPAVLAGAAELRAGPCGRRLRRARRAGQ
jgi:NAD(P)H-dependent FMN reductase